MFWVAALTSDNVGLVTVAIVVASRISTKEKHAD
jgi:hypothetical protein